MAIRDINQGTLLRHMRAGTRHASLRPLLIAKELWERAYISEMSDRGVLTSPAAVKDYLQTYFVTKPHEVFLVLFLDVQNRLISVEEMFRGTLTQTSVYPREVVIRALDLQAAAVVLAHNHPSGSAQPSRADELLTRTLKAALALVDVRVLDHVVIGGMSSFSLAERGLM